MKKEFIKELAELINKHGLEKEKTRKEAENETR